MKDMIQRTARTNLMIVPDFRNEIRTIVPSDLIWSGFAVKSFIDGNDVDIFINF
jgi:hypothetical protein